MMAQCEYEPYYDPKLLCPKCNTIARAGWHGNKTIFEIYCANEKCGKRDGYSTDNERAIKHFLEGE